MIVHGRHGHTPAATAPGNGPEADGQRLWMVLVATGLAMFTIDLDFFALNLALPRMARDLDVTATDLQWVISGFLLAIGAFMIPGGRLGDILGRRRVLIAGIALFGGASAACAAAPSAEVVIGFRVVQGIGAAILFPLCVAVVTNAFPEARRKRAIGNLYGLGAIATAAGPFLGGFITEQFGWRWVFLLNVPIAIGAIALALVGVRESRDESVPRQIDLRGLAAVALGIAAVTYAVDRGPTWGWISADTIALFIAGVALLVAFVAIERRVRWPLVDLDLFRNFPYVMVTAAGTVANIAFVVTTFAATLYLQRVEGLSPAEAGLVFLSASGPLALAGPASGLLAERYDVPRLMTVAIPVGAVGLLVFAAGAGPAVYVPALVLFGGGYGLCWSLTSVGTQTVVPPKVAGEASGITLAIVIGLAGLCVTVAAAVTQEVTEGGTSEGVAIDDILRVIAISSAIAAAVLAVAMRRRPRAAEHGA